MVFTLAIVFASSNQAATGSHGTRPAARRASLGLAVALAIAYVIFKLGRRLNLGLFFRVIGIVLMVFAAGLLADAVENMQQLGWLPFLGHTLWNTSGFLSEDSSLGDVFHSLLGYADQPTVLQVIVWVAYVAVVAHLVHPYGPPRPAAPSSRPRRAVPLGPDGPDAAAESRRSGEDSACPSPPSWPTPDRTRLLRPAPHPRRTDQSAARDTAIRSCRSLEGRVDGPPVRWMRMAALEVPSMAGRTVVITGGNSGVGKATADALAGAGSPDGDHRPQRDTGA